MNMHTAIDSIVSFETPAVIWLHNAAAKLREIEAQDNLDYIAAGFPPASEALYYDDAHVAHIVAYDERRRLARITAANVAALRGAKKMEERL